MSPEIKNVFISHVHEDDSVLKDFKEMLDKNGYQIRDSSINSDKPNQAQSPEYIKNEILAPRIRWASTMVVLISEITHESPWVDWEIEYAKKQGKRIVGVYVQNGTESDDPESLKLYADAVVGWQSGRVIDAISGSLNNWETPGGAPRPPRPIDRYDCSSP